MQENQIIRAVVDVLTGKVIYEFTIQVRKVKPVLPPKLTIWEKLKGVKPPTAPEPETERTFQIFPAVVVNQYRIAASALSLPVDLFDDPTRMLAYVPAHLKTMVYIIAAAVQNNEEEPDPELIRFFELNLDNPDIVQILSASLQGTHMQSFLSSILLMQGEATILTSEGSPTDGSESIASHIE